MSTNSECLFVEHQPDQWFYVLEDIGAPKNAWDWMDNAEAYGPFPTKDQAVEHLGRFHANPGGWVTQPYREGYEPGETLKRLIENAADPSTFGSWGRRW